MVLMKELEEKSVRFAENPNDLIVAFSLLFNVPQIQPLNHAFAKTLREVYFNGKFKDTVQEFLVLFISRNLGG